MKKLLLTSICAVLLLSTCRKDSDGVSGSETSTQRVGYSAHDLLSADKYSSLKLQIHYMPGFAPDSRTITDMRDFLSSLLHKPGGIQVEVSQVASANRQVYSLQDITTLESEFRTAFTSGSTIALHLLIVDGAYSNSNVLGIAYRNTSMVLFGRTIHDHSGGLTQVSRTFLETLVIEHELGHLMGLVNIGSPMQSGHEDANNHNHCNNQNCLMYWATETTDILSSLTGSMPVLDNNCRADLRANGGL